MRVPIAQEPDAPGEQVVDALAIEVSAIQDAVPQISPFVGLLYDVSRVGPLERVTTPPYDTISLLDRRRFERADPHNVVRLVLGEDLPGDDEHENKYRRAASSFRRWREEGALVPTPGPTYFAYEMRFRLHGDERRLKGLVCLVDLEGRGGSIVPHEKTMAGPIEDRLKLMRAVRANLSCIHAVHAGPRPRVAELLEGATAGEPVASLMDEAGVEHRMWRLADRHGVVAGSLQDATLMIADGHHRYMMALRYRGEMRAEHGPGPWDRVMMLLVDAATEEPPVLPIHRILLAGAPPTEGTRVRDLEEVLNEVSDEGLVYGVATREDDALVHRVARLRGKPPAVRALHEQVLDAADGDLAFTHDPVEAEDAVREGRARAAFFLPATTAGRIRSMIERGERLPRKSTFFWPKPRTGIVIRPLD